MSFWGLVLEPKKSYTQREVEKPFHISMAALDLQNCETNEPVSVFCRQQDSDFILCSLSKKHSIFNVPLNLDVALGGEINFHVEGNGTVHLTGFIIEEDLEEFEDSDESIGEEEEEDMESTDILLKNTKKKLEAVNKRLQSFDVETKPKKGKLSVKEEDEDEDDSDFDVDSNESGEEEEVEEEEEEDDEDDDEAEDVVPQQQAKKKQAKQNDQVAAAAAAQGKQGKKDKKEAAKAQAPAPQANKNANGAQPQANGTTKKVVEGGVQIEDMKVGNGAVAKSGKMVVVYYVGRLKANNKQFDSTTSGPGFKFRLGRGEVIRGWDVGVAGMKVGGKRRLTIPPKMGYGEKGAGSAIPPNSALIFDVELKNVK